MNVKKILRRTGIAIIIITLPSTIFFSILYLKYNEPFPKDAVPSVEADRLARQMLEALNYEDYKNTEYIEWTFKNRHHFKWQKNKGVVEVYWKNIKVILQLAKPHTSLVFKGDEEITKTSKKEKYITKATNYFNNDSFWLAAPYKVFDKGTIRSIIPQNKGVGLLVTYTKGGTTPGDSYLWILDENYIPISYKMWVDILPINGLEATWDDWETVSTGATFATNHQFYFMSLPITDLKVKKL